MKLQNSCNFLYCLAKKNEFFKRYFRDCKGKRRASQSCLVKTHKRRWQSVSQPNGVQSILKATVLSVLCLDIDTHTCASFFTHNWQLNWREILILI